MARAGLQVIDACDSYPMLGLTVEEIDVSNDEYLRVRVWHGGASREIKLRWEHMREQTPKSTERLLARLGRWVRVLKSDEGRRHRRFDGRFERIVGQ
jgi:hypothetical protein